MNRRILVTGGSGFIGTNLVEYYRDRGESVVNLDLLAPRDERHSRHWSRVDLVDTDATRTAIRTHDPTHIVHCGARTDLHGTTAADYRVNITGTSNLLDAVAEAPSLRRVVIASSMLVCRNGYVPTADDDYCPDTAYGESKRAMELAVRSRDDLDVPWVLVRPTSIWGPWFGEPYRPFFEAVRRGRYVHPGRRRVPKALGYVGNVVAQIDALLGSDRFDGAMTYLCDTPEVSIGEWADAIADGARRARPRTVPVALLRAVAAGGDLASRVGVPHPPLTSFRLANMLTESSFDTTALRELVGELPYSMATGVGATLAWLDDQD